MEKIQGTRKVTKRFLKLDKEVLDIFWSDLSELFSTVIKNQGSGRDNLELLYAKIKNNIFEVWIYKGEDSKIQAAFCTGITQYPEKKVLFWGYMSAVDNNMAEWKGPMLKCLKDYANQNICDCIEFFSPRMGWNKIFTDAGATVKNIGTVYEVSLNGDE
jgi:hypothetical protein